MCSGAAACAKFFDSMLWYVVPRPRRPPQAPSANYKNRKLKHQHRYDTEETIRLLKCFSDIPESRRRIFFESMLDCRRRDSKNWNFTSVAKVFQHHDEKEMMRIREIVVRVQRAVQKMNLSLEELFERCDLNHDGSIAETELASAFEQLGIVKSISIDAKLIMRYADRNDDHSISLTEFLSRSRRQMMRRTRWRGGTSASCENEIEHRELSSETSTDDRETISKQRSHRFFQRSKTLSTTILPDLIGAFG